MLMKTVSRTSLCQEHSFSGNLICILKIVINLNVGVANAKKGDEKQTSKLEH